MHYVSECNEAYSELSHDVFFFLPILIVDGPVFECYFEKGSSDLKAGEVNELVFMQNYLSPSYGRVTTRVTVLTLSALAGSLVAYEQWGLHMIQTMRARLTEASH